MAPHPNIFSSSIAENLSELFSLDGRTALVTGAGSGIGKRMGIVLSAVGADVYFADINEKNLLAATDESKAMGFENVNSICMDVTNPKSVESSFKRIGEEAGKLDVLICSAGTSGSKWIEDMSLELWNRVLTVNLTGTFLCCKEAVKLMISHRWGRIINIGSIAATYVPRPERFNGGYNYSASKAGVVILTKRLAVELAPYNITANCISPAWVKTPLTEKAVEDKHTRIQMIESIPLHRLGVPRDLDGLVVYLSSESSGYLTGQDILLDGGYSVW